MFVHLAVIWFVVVAQASSQSLSSDELLKRFHSLNLPVARYGGDSEGLGGFNDALRHKRFDIQDDYGSFEDPYTKRTSLKRLAILSARGFGRK